jgi:uncharacterized zinc-type alcohol dehydrogenase-like protein
VITANALSCAGPTEPFRQTTLERRDLRPDDVLIDIAYAGICHSDVHHVRSDWGHTTYPIVPGHEIAGVVSAVGDAVSAFAPGDRVGVGCMVDSCRECENCSNGMEQYCTQGHILTYNAIDRHGERTFGGYSDKIVVSDKFVLRIPDELDLAEAAPLLCAGITLYSPLSFWGAGPGKHVGIVGMGGLGHVGVQLSRAMGAHTTVFNLSRDLEAEARKFGADDYRVTSTDDALEGLGSSFDLIISTVPAELDLDAYLGLLRLDGTFVNLGVPARPLSIRPHSLLHNRRSIAGSLIGSIAETQDMLDFCADHGCSAQVEIVSADEVDDAYDRLGKGDVRFRFVIDVASMRSGVAT